MRIALAAHRRSHWVLVGPLASASIQRGHTVTYLRDPSLAKIHDEWFESEIPSALKGRIATQPSMTDRWYLGPTPLSHPFAKLCTIEAWYDDLAMGHAQLASFHHRTLRHGMIALDGLADVTPGEHRNLVWFVPKTSVPGVERWYRLCVTMLIGLALWHTARRLGLHFVVKTRPKIWLSPVIKRLADKVSGDDMPLYPWPSLRALSTAALAVCHQSAVGWEAVASGVPALSIRLPQRHLRRLGNWPLLSARHGSPYAWPGLIDSHSVESGLRWLSHLDHEPKIDMGERQKYIDTWLGGRVTGTSEWLIEQLERIR